jgi:hypothetical protein
VIFAACRSFASVTSEVAKILMPNTVKPLVKFALFASAVVTRFEELSPTLPTTLEQLVQEVYVVDVVVEVDESSDFLHPRIRNNGSETTSIILSNFIFSSSGNC